MSDAEPEKKWIDLLKLDLLGWSGYLISLYISRGGFNWERLGYWNNRSGASYRFLSAKFVGRLLALKYSTWGRVEVGLTLILIIIRSPGGWDVVSYCSLVNFSIVVSAAYNHLFLQPF